VVRVSFRAPRDFVYDWCTDYTPGDAKLEGETYDRRIISRKPRRVVYEDLYEGNDGWRWSRHEVTLRPPDRWHSESVGNYRHIKVDYRLRPLADGRTELELRARRGPSFMPFRPIPKREWEKEIAVAWRRFGRNLERDYRASKGRARKG
jgi:hypothetical protein